MPGASRWLAAFDVDAEPSTRVNVAITAKLNHLRAVTGLLPAGTPPGCMVMELFLKPYGAGITVG